MTEETLPLSKEEKAHYTALSLSGETLPLSIVKRYIATIRKNFLASPKAVEKGKTTRNKKPTITEDQIDFF